MIYPIANPELGDRKQTIFGTIALLYPLFLLTILVQNFMLIKNHTETWVIIHC